MLDIGCGTGHLALAVARRFNPAHILGVELDKSLVHAANQNIRHFLSHDLVVKERRKAEGVSDVSSSAHPKKEGTGGESREEGAAEGVEEVMAEFNRALSLLPLPLSFRVSRGPLSAPPVIIPSHVSSRFPSNITFLQVSLHHFL